MFYLLRVNTTGWKVFDRNLQCRGFQFEIGKTYTESGDTPELCSHGFHFHTNTADLFNYYDFDPNNRVCEILYDPVKTVHGDDKSATLCISIIKELSWYEVLDLVNSGKGNSGNWNSGDGNSGDRNTGDGNSGHGNSGNRNSGHWNSGDGNTGDGNSGNRNTGHWNSGDGCFNYLCTKKQCFVFDKPFNGDVNNVRFPNFFYFNLCEWVWFRDMTDEEKEKHPGAEIRDGYLKTYEYKEAWRNSWGKATDEDKRKVLDIPNWDNGKFLEITGIDVEKELGEK